MERMTNKSVYIICCVHLLVVICPVIKDLKYKTNMTRPKDLSDSNLKKRMYFIKKKNTDFYNNQIQSK
jgi:hypothetical protein